LNCEDDAIVDGAPLRHRKHRRRMICGCSQGAEPIEAWRDPSDNSTSRNAVLGWCIDTLVEGKGERVQDGSVRCRLELLNGEVKVAFNEPITIELLRGSIKVELGTGDNTRLDMGYCASYIEVLIRWNDGTI